MIQLSPQAVSYDIGNMEGVLQKQVDKCQASIKK